MLATTPPTPPPNRHRSERSVTSCRERATASTAGGSVRVSPSRGRSGIGSGVDRSGRVGRVDTTATAWFRTQTEANLAGFQYLAENGTTAQVRQDAAREVYVRSYVQTPGEYKDWQELEAEKEQTRKLEADLKADRKSATLLIPGVLPDGETPFSPTVIPRMRRGIPR